MLTRALYLHKFTLSLSYYILLIISYKVFFKTTKKLVFFKYDIDNRKCKYTFLPYDQSRIVIIQFHIFLRLRPGFASV